MSRKFKTLAFAKEARKAGVSDLKLSQAIDECERGLIDAQLGGGLIKKRIAREGAGKSGGYRTIIALQAGEKAFFLELFAKNDRENLPDTDLQALKQLANLLLGLTDAQLKTALRLGEFQELE